MQFHHQIHVVWLKCNEHKENKQRLLKRLSCPIINEISVHEPMKIILLSKYSLVTLLQCFSKVNVLLEF